MYDPFLCFYFFIFWSLNHWTAREVQIFLYSFFFFPVLFIYLFIFKLYNIVLVLPNIEMNPPQVYMCSPSWILLPPPSPYHPSGSSQCTSPMHPVSCIEPGLATCSIYDIIHISMPFSQIIPPSPSPTESKRLFYTSVSLCCLVYRVMLLNVFLYLSMLSWKWKYVGFTRIKSHHDL